MIVLCPASALLALLALLVLLAPPGHHRLEIYQPNSLFPRSLSPISPLTRLPYLTPHLEAL